MSFADDMHRFTVKVEAKTQAVFVDSVAQAFTSIVEGSPVTGAPGQPVDTGNLRASWQMEFENPTSALISTNVEYAPYIEDGIVAVGSHSGNATGSTRQRLTLRSAVGGFHSVALTIAGFNRIVEVATAEAKP